MNLKKINCLQFCSILLINMLASFLGVGVFSIIKAASVDACFSVIFSSIFGIFALIMFLCIFNYEPDLPLTGKLNKLFGKKIGTILIIFIIIMTFISGINAMFNLTNFITSQFLPETSLLLIGIIFSFLIIMINIKGIEIISRVTIIIITINIILYLIAFFGLIPDFDFSNLKPILEHGINPPLYGSLFIVCNNIIPVFILLTIPKNTLVDKENFNKFVIPFYFAGFVLMFFAIFQTLGNLGIHLVNIYQYPEYIVLKNVDILGFADRIENIVTSQWIFGLFIYITMVVYLINNSIKFNNKSYLLPTSITILILAFSKWLFPNNTIFNEYIYKYSLFPKLLVLVILTFTAIAIILKEKKIKLK